MASCVTEEKRWPDQKIEMKEGKLTNKHYQVGKSQPRNRNSRKNQENTSHLQTTNPIRAGTDEDEMEVLPYTELTDVFTAN